MEEFIKIVNNLSNNEKLGDSQNANNKSNN